MIGILSIFDGGIGVELFGGLYLKFSLSEKRRRRAKIEFRMSLNLKAVEKNEIKNIYLVAVLGKRSRAVFLLLLSDTYEAADLN